MSVLNPSKQEQLEAERVIVAHYNMNRERYDRARSVQTKLGLGGLWRGTETTLAVIIEALCCEPSAVKADKEKWAILR